MLSTDLQNLSQDLLLHSGEGVQHQRNLPMATASLVNHAC